MGFISSGPVWEITALRQEAALRHKAQEQWNDYLRAMVLVEGENMSEHIEVGDRVRRKDGGTWGDGTYVTTVSQTGVYKVWGTPYQAGWMPRDQVEKAYPYDEVVRAWLDGKTVQKLVDGWWTDVPRSRKSSEWVPAFSRYAHWRIKPERTERDMDIERIEQEMRSLADKLKELKDE